MGGRGNKGWKAPSAFPSAPPPHHIPAPRQTRRRVVRSRRSARRRPPPRLTSPHLLSGAASLPGIPSRTQPAPADPEALAQAQARGDCATREGLPASLSPPQKRALAKKGLGAPQRGPARGQVPGGWLVAGQLSERGVKRQEGKRRPLSTKEVKRQSRACALGGGGCELGQAEEAGRRRGGAGRRRLRRQLLRLPSGKDPLRTRPRWRRTLHRVSCHPRNGPDHKRRGRCARSLPGCQ
ncbi:uncharacterized protein LOC141552904 [Sminthopsis crassicaudata]|uniref:uncharacterized protein LOC141552904 n=1 Tax=Sminthopsis crassicaudata TaxID=9301 RepID=UPI003D69C8AF